MSMLQIIQAEPYLVKNFPVYSTDVIADGDMLWWDGSNNAVRPASAFTWTTSLAVTQEAFAKVFKGIAKGRKLAAQSADIAVCMCGELEASCASATFVNGALLSPANSGSSTLENQKLVTVTQQNLAVARVVKRQASVTRVFAMFEDSVMGKNLQAEAIITTGFTPAEMFRDADGDVLASTLTTPYITEADNVQRATWAASDNAHIRTKMEVPQSFDAAADSIAIKALVIQTAGNDTITLDAEVYGIRGGAAVTADFNPTAAAITKTQTSPELVTISLTGESVAPGDVLDVALFPTAHTTDALHIYAAWLETQRR